MNRNIQRRTFLAAAGAAGAAGALPAPGSGPWQAGVAKVAITPREPVWLAGYGARNKPSEGALHDIWVKALALRDASGAISVVLTSDILGFSRQMAAEAAVRVEKQYWAPRERLALTSSHTHSAPVTGNVLRPAYDIDERQIKVIERYTADLLGKVVEVIGAAIRDLAPAQLSFGQERAGFAVNRRPAEYPRPVDHDVPVLAVRGAGGNLRAVLFGYACHNTVLSGYEVSGDYSGFAQIALEKQHPGAVALFVAGCGADANPLPRRKVELAAAYGNILAEAVTLVVNGKMRPLAPSLEAAFTHVDLHFQTPPTRDELTARLKAAPAEARHARHLLDILDREGRLPDRYPYPVQVWRFSGSPGLTWIVLGGEVVVDYALRFKRQYGVADTWVTGYSNDVFAYIPSVRVLKEGGYEGATSMVPYGQPAPFRATVEEAVAETVDELVRRTR